MHMVKMHASPVVSSLVANGGSYKLPVDINNAKQFGRLMCALYDKYDLITDKMVSILTQTSTFTIAQIAPVVLPFWLQLLTASVGVPVGIASLINYYYLIRKTRLEAIEKAEQRKVKTELSLSNIASVFNVPNPKILKISTSISVAYWVLTGLLPLVSLYVTSGTWSKCWTIATTFPHLYLHSMCVGLFMALSLQEPVAAIISSPRFRKQTFAMALLLALLAVLFIINEVVRGPDLYSVDTTGIFLPLSTALQVFGFAFGAAVILLTAIGILTHNSPATADTRVVNQLFTAALYGSLWIPMRIAYESQYPQPGLVRLLAGYQMRTWLIVFTFSICVLTLCAVVMLKQRKWLLPLTTAVCTLCMLFLGMYPRLCQLLFGRDSEVLIFGTLLSFAALFWLSTTVPGDLQNR